MFIIVIYTTKLNRGNGIIVSYSGIVPEVATLGLLKTNQIWEFKERRERFHGGQIGVLKE